MTTASRSPDFGGSSQRLVAPSHRRPIQSVKIAVVEMVAHRLPHLVESRSLDRRSARLAMNRPSTQCGKATEGQGAPARDAYVAHDDATANRCTCQVQRQDDRFVSGLFCRHAKLGRSQRSQLSVVDDAHPCGRKDNVRERSIIWILAQHVMRHVSKKTMIGSKLFITLFSRPPGVISVRSWLNRRQYWRCSVGIESAVAIESEREARAQRATELSKSFGLKRLEP